MWKFIKQVILHPRRTGAVMPSGPDLVKAMIAPIDFIKAKHIVELGPGTGAITRALLAEMKPDATLTVIEINKDFCKHLQDLNDKRLNVVHNDAAKLSALVDKADYVVSGLPLVGFPKKQRAIILSEIKKVAKRKYVQFHYSPLAESDIKQVFKNVSKKAVVRNIPPAIVYTCY